jgi:uncharacterized damage-inducible protein DinB
MPIELGKQFRSGITAAESQLRRIGEQGASQKIRADSWSPKELLGHLIDSALNNHQRFVRAALDGFYEGPGYEQNRWVDLHGYAEQPWTELFDHWSSQNELLCCVVDRIPEERLEAACRIGGGAPVTLSFLIEDYLVHLHHHVAQIVAAESGVAGLFMAYSMKKLRQMSEYVAQCLTQLTEEQLWQRSAEHCNSIGNLVLHLCGNMRQWIVHGIGGSADIRTRDAEFAAKGGQSPAQVLAVFESTVADALAVLSELPPERLTERTTPQKEEVAMLEAIYQVVGHLQQHVGQIIFATKQLTGNDLHLYKP